MCTTEDFRPLGYDCVTPFELSGPLMPADTDRRSFLKTVAGVAAGAGAVSLLSGRASAEDKPAASVTPKPAEALIKELHSTLSDDQKSKLVLPWDHGGGKGQTPSRLRMYNGPFEKHRIDEQYTKAQQDLSHQILKAILADDEGYRRISKDGTWDNSGAFERCGAHIFGNPSGDGQFAWLFTGHHLTVRCDGNSMPGAAFGGPMYYGHLDHGYSADNVFNYQTKRAMAVFEALDEMQRKQAVADGTPGEQAPSIQFRGKGQPRPGIDIGDLSKDQQELVQLVMRDILSPYRKEDVDEVMDIVKANGGLEEMHIAFYADKDRPQEGEPWHFWRLEGPGFVWNYRVIPHVHCFVNIAKIA
jgi:hypothetical protein